MAISTISDTGNAAHAGTHADLLAGTAAENWAIHAA